MSGDFKTRSIVEPAIILESPTGKKLQIINKLNPYEWVNSELRDLQNDVTTYKGETISMGCITILATLFFAMFTHTYYFAGIAFFGSLLFTLLSYRRFKIALQILKDFKADIDNQQPDMERSIVAYFGHREAQYLVFFVNLPQYQLVDYEITDIEEDINLKIIYADEQGDVFRKTIRCKPLQNLHLEYPIITIHPGGVSIEIPVQKQLTI